MPETLTILVYSFDELDERAKECARDKWRQHALDYEWWEHIYEDAIEIGALLGITIDKINFSGFASQGYGASFTGTYKCKDDAILKVKAYASEDTELHRIAEALTVLQATVKLQYGQTLECQVDRSSSMYFHEMTMWIDCNLDDDVCDLGQSEDTLLELLRDFARWIYKQLEAENDYQLSDEFIDDSIRANALRFDEDGNTI